MSDEQPNKHAQRSERTRARIIRAAEQLFARKGVDAVSLNEIMSRAGQKNRNALQYHFGNRRGLIEALLQVHNVGIAERRRTWIDEHEAAGWPASEILARALIVPVVEHMNESQSGVHYVQILAQLARSHKLFGPSEDSPRLPTDRALLALVDRALHQLAPVERNQRLFLAVGSTFHALADIYRVADTPSGRRALGTTDALVEQLIVMIAGLLGSSPQKAKR